MVNKILKKIIWDCHERGSSIDKLRIELLLKARMDSVMDYVTIYIVAAMFLMLLAIFKITIFTIGSSLFLFAIMLVCLIKVILLEKQYDNYLPKFFMTLECNSQQKVRRKQK